MNTRPCCSAVQWILSNHSATLILDLQVWSGLFDKSSFNHIQQVGSTRGRQAHLIIACRANLSQASMLKMPNLSAESFLMSEKRLIVRFSLIGTVLTKVVNDRPLPKVKAITLVLGSSACAVTCTSGTCSSHEQVSAINKTQSPVSVPDVHG